MLIKIFFTQFDSKKMAEEQIWPWTRW